MEKAKLSDLLKALSTRERTRFREMALSPFFNKNPKITALLDFLLSFAPDFSSPKLTKERAYRAVYGQGSTFNELRINNLISDTLQLGYQLLAQLELSNRPALERELLLNPLLDRRASRHLRQNARRMKQLTRQLPFRSVQHLHQTVQEAYLLDRAELLRAPRRYNPYLQAHSDQLDLYFSCQKLRAACDMASRNRAINAGYSCQYIDTVLSWHQQPGSPLRQWPAITVYAEAYAMLTTDKEAHYRQLKVLLQGHRGLFPQEELQDLYDYLQNFCVKQINSGHTAYYREILENYKEMLAQGLLHRQGMLTQWTYINIATAGIRLQEFEWTEWFLRTYREELDPENRENVFTYNLAALQFEQSAYHKTLQTLQDVDFSDAFYHMSAKIIQLKSYYELGEEEALLALLEASRKYIRRNRQLSAYQKKSNQHFLKAIGWLQKAKSRRRQFGSAAPELPLRSDIQALEPVNNKGWLLDKARQLEGQQPL